MGIWTKLVEASRDRSDELAELALTIVAESFKRQGKDLPGAIAELLRDEKTRVKKNPFKLIINDEFPVKFFDVEILADHYAESLGVFIPFKKASEQAAVMGFYEMPNTRLAVDKTGVLSSTLQLGRLPHTIRARRDSRFVRWQGQQLFDYATQTAYDYAEDARILGFDYIHYHYKELLKKIYSSPTPYRKR